MSYSNFITTPLSKGYIKWHTMHPDKDGMCQLRISEGFYDEEESYTVLSVTGSVTEDGWFKCGRMANTYEQKQVLFPDIS